MKKVQKKEKVTLDDLYAYLYESKKESELEFKKMREETDRQMKETDLQFKETDRKIREVSRQLGDMGNSNGDVAEEYFQNAFKKNPSLNGEIFDKIDFNVKPLSLNGQIGNEYDIVMINGKSVAIIEIKYHLTKKGLEKELRETLHKLETFKAFYPEYRNHKFYQGIASLSFTKSAESLLQKEGIAVIKQVGDKMVINSENLKKF